jgi:hypothetical protein
MNRQAYISFSLLTVLLAGVTVWLAQPVTGAEPPFEVVAGGLDNPRGLAFGQNGALYIAEAGRGGEGFCLRTTAGHVCFGPSGAITQVLDGQQTRVVRGLPSKAGAGGYRALGPHDLTLGAGNIAFVVTGLGFPAGSPETRDAFGPNAVDFGKLLRVDLKQGTWESMADFVAYEAANDPDGGVVDSNPYAILSVPGGFLVVDAAGNDLLSVKYNGEISTLALFPSQMVEAPPSSGLPEGAQIPAQAVPTAVALGPDLALYVGELTGAPFVPGSARVYRIVTGSEPEVFAEGFTNIVDLEFRPNDGLLYVLEHARNGLMSGDTTGALIRINEDGSRDVIASDGLVSPGGLAFGPDGAAYVTTFSENAEVGQVVRIPLQGPLLPGLVARFAFEGNVNDSVGGHNGTAYGDPSYALGRFGQAISLDGIDDYVVVGSVGISGNDPRTIAGWVKASTTTFPEWINIFGFTGPTVTWGHYDLELVGNSSSTTLGWYGMHIEGAQINILPVDSEWHHLAATFDGKWYHEYGDGRHVHSSDGDGGRIVLNTPDNVHVGKRWDNDNHFPGLVDEVQIFNRALSATEIAELAGR